MQTWVVFSAIQTQLSTHLDTNEKLTSAFQCFFFFFFFEKSRLCFSSGSHAMFIDSQVFYSATFSLKIDPTTPFTYLKIILLQYF